MTDRSFYFDRLYPLQDELLRLLGKEGTGFYLSGGTAASRGYLNHRFSDDLAVVAAPRSEGRRARNKMVRISDSGHSLLQTIRK